MDKATEGVKRNLCNSLLFPLISGMLLLGLLNTGCDRPDVTSPSAANDDASAAPTSPSVEKKVLLVQSYHAGYEWTDSITRGVRMALPQRDVDLQVYYMDAKRNPSEEWKQRAGAEARRIVSEWRPAVVIAADDNAQQYFAKDYAGNDDVPIVFCGVNNEPEDYGYPARNITGILERPHFKESLDYLKKILPQARRIAIVSDNSETSVGALNHMKDLPDGMTVVSRQMPAFFDEWQAAIQACQTNADAIAIYTYHTVKLPGQTTSMPSKDVIRWTLENNRLPLIGFFVFAVDDGALCGYLESGVEQGRRAAQMAWAILEGKSPAELPLITAVEGQSMLNLKTAQKLSITVPDEVIQATDLVIRE